jgi:hypothetical protein
MPARWSERVALRVLRDLPVLLERLEIPDLKALKETQAYKGILVFPESLGSVALLETQEPV